MTAYSLPNHGRIYFKTAADVVITSAGAFWGPLISEYSGIEVTPSEVKNTSLFVCFGFSQRFLSVRVVDQGHYIWVNAVEKFLITGLKDHGSHTEFIGLRAIAVVEPAPPATSVISEWGFRSLAEIGNDEQGLNSLSDINTVGWSSDKPSEVSSAFGSLYVQADNSERLEITDASQSGLDITGNLTIAFRFKMLSLAPWGGGFNTAGYVCKGGSTGAGNAGYYVYTDTSDKVKCELSSDGSLQTTAVGGTSLSTNVWHSCAVVYNGTDIRIYLDGSLDSNGSNNPKAYSSGIKNNDQKFAIGSRGDGTQFIDARICHVFIFDVAKSASEISNWHSNDAWS